MQNIDMIRHADPDKLAGMLCRWIVQCTRDCPALGQCRGGMSCRDALHAWLIAEADDV